MQAYGNQSRRIVFPNPTEELTGLVQNKKASDLEERFARAMNKLPDWGYTFRVRINPITHRLSQRFTNLAGELEIDFLARRGTTLLPILVDGEVGHYLAAWMKDLDAEKKDNIDRYMRSYGAMPSIRVEFWRLANQEMTDQYVRQLLQ